MSNIKVGRYKAPEVRQHWQGWIEPEDRTWIVFVDSDGHCLMYDRRDEDGGVIE